MSILIWEPENLSPLILEKLKNIKRTYLKQDLGTETLNPSDISLLIVKLKYKINRDVLKQFPNLKYVATPTTGTDHIDLRYCKEKKIKILSLKDETILLRDLTATAELTWGHILNLKRKLVAAHNDVVNGFWRRDKFMGDELKGSSLGVIGFGRLGKMVAKYGTAFGMSVSFFDPYVEDGGSAQKKSLDELLAGSDVVSLHVHLNEETKKMIGKEQFDLMNDNTIFVNTSRALLVDQEALLYSLMEKKIAGAALDVLENEYLEDGQGSVSDNLLVKYAQEKENLLLSPHIGGLTQQSLMKAEERLVAIIRENL